MNNALKISLPTRVTIRGHITYHQLVEITFTPHTRNILGRNYHQLLTDPNISTLDSRTPPLRYNPAKGLQGKRAEKVTWLTTLSLHQDVLANY